MKTSSSDWLWLPNSATAKSASTISRSSATSLAWSPACVKPNVLAVELDFVRRAAGRARRPAAARRPARAPLPRGAASAAAGFHRRVPTASSLPRSMMPTWSHISASSVRMCELTSTVLPSAASWRIISRSSIRARGSRPLAGSSRISTLGIVNHRPAQAEPLPHPFRQAADRFVGQLIQPREAHRVLNRLMPLAAGEAIGAGKEIEILVAIDVGIGAEIVGHEAQPAADAIGIVDARKAIDKGVARRSAGRASPGFACSSSCPRRWGRYSQTPAPRPLRTTHPARPASRQRTDAGGEARSSD